MSIILSVADSLIMSGIDQFTAEKWRNRKRDKQLQDDYNTWLERKKGQPYYNALDRALSNSNIIQEFITSICCPDRQFSFSDQKAFIPTNDGKNVGIKDAGDVGINRDAVIKILKKQPHATAKSLVEAINLSPRQVERVLAELKKEGTKVRKGSNKSGWWEVN